MAGKPNTKWLSMMIEKYGSREAVSEVMREQGSRGGKSPAKYPKGFAAMTPEKRSAAGRKGGKNRWKGKQNEDEHRISS